MLVEHSTDAGDLVQIVYRNGGLVDANALESLCDKVQQALTVSSYGALYPVMHPDVKECCVRCRWDGPAGR